MYMQDSRSAQGEELHLRAGCGQSICSLLQHGPFTLMTSRWLLVPPYRKEPEKGALQQGLQSLG
jgi:hypothetical protein